MCASTSGYTRRVPNPSLQCTTSRYPIFRPDDAKRHRGSIMTDKLASPQAHWLFWHGRHSDVHQLHTGPGFARLSNVSQSHHQNVPAQQTQSYPKTLRTSFDNPNRIPSMYRSNVASPTTRLSSVPIFLVPLQYSQQWEFQIFPVRRPFCSALGPFSTGHTSSYIPNIVAGKCKLFLELTTNLCLTRRNKTMQWTMTFYMPTRVFSNGYVLAITVRSCTQLFQRTAKRR